ncbi:MAG: site-2 protease family protein [Erysipelotrichia bacterium]|jgi:regulator of sigma E protease|nr:site-2 protease family protein [Erysipelotrichia bacterium]
MTFILFILMIGVLITFHELGHMLAAKVFNVYVKEFAVGFGPKLLSHQGKETLYTLRAIPFGGYTAMVDENKLDEENENSDEETTKSEAFTIEEERTFYGVSALKRIVILLSGPIFNFLLAMVIFISIFSAVGVKAIYPKAIIEQVIENSPAQSAGLMVEDEIIAITYANNEKVEIKTTYDVAVNNSLHKGAYTLTVLRGNETIDILVEPVYDEKSKSYLIGIVFSGETEFQKLKGPEAIVEGIKHTFESAILTFKSVISIFTGNIGLENVSGIVGMYSITEEALSYSLMSYFSLVASISISLCVMNLIPIPIFDGGRILMTIIEVIIGKRDEKIESIVLTISMFLVLALFILITISDIGKLFR